MSLPISSTIFNRNLLRDTLALNIPLQVKFEVLSDPTKIHLTVPVESLTAVLAVLVESIRKTFLLGMVCAILCALATAFVPFKSLIVEGKKPELRDIKESQRRLPVDYVLTSF